jgi:N-acetylneuraminate synthase
MSSVSGNAPYETSIALGERAIAADRPTYFVADIASNHDGDLGRAKELIWLCHEAGADAAKFQHFQADSIVSNRGFQALGAQVSHQAEWKESVFEVYKRYQLPRDWTSELAATAREASVAFLSTPYDREAVEELAPIVPAFKIGSGDITWTQMLEIVASAGKPVLLATGASTQEDVERAVNAVLAHNRSLVLMQCNTNYTGDPRNFAYVNLNVLRTFAERWPRMPLGLSDHTPDATAVLGAVAIGARVIEKHFTDDPGREGPDHAFSLDPRAWREMVDRTRELELALGDGVKRVEENERETMVVQRRCLRLTRDLPVGAVLEQDHLEALRPAPEDALLPYELDRAIGRRLTAAKSRGDALYPSDLEADRA